MEAPGFAPGSIGDALLSLQA